MFLVNPGDYVDDHDHLKDKVVVAVVPVKCADCQHFERDQIGDGSGIGKCKKIIEYKAALSKSGLLINAAAYRLRSAQAVCDCGDKPLYPYVKRYCKRFEGKC